MKEISIKTEFIKLDQLLKFIGIAPTGGHAKFLIPSGCVEINGHSVSERGKKVRNGDIVRVNIEEEKVFKTFKIVGQ